MRKLLLRTGLLSALTAFIFITAAWAEEATVTGNEVNFRAGPGVNYEVTDCLAKGSVVTVNDRSNSEWYNVTYNGKTGFIYASYIKITESASDTQQSTVTVTESSGSGTINAMYVRFRSGPSTDFSILGEYNTGTSVSILGTSGSWSKVSINGQEGYVFTSYITLGSDTVAVEQTVVEQTPAPVVENTDSAAETQPAVQVNETTASNGYINGDYVRFRTGPSTNYSIISSYNRNQQVTVTGTSGDWSRVTINGTEGYVFTKYVTLTSSDSGSTGSETAVTSTETATGYVKGSSVRFRAGASMYSEILGEYNTGTELQVTGTSGDWSRVVINGTTGYIYSSYITTVKPAVSTEGSSKGQAVANYAMQFLGYNYVWGGTSPSEGFDCSGLVYYVYGQFGYTLHRVACDMAGDGTHVDASQLQPGDILCFYSTSDYIGHVGIYIGNNQFIHASTYTTGVIISDLDSGYYANNFEARRIVD